MAEETPALEGTYADLALQYMSQGWKVLPVSGKFPPVEGATGRNGVIDADKVELWRRTPETADMNIALRAEGWIGIDPDQYEKKTGADQLAELEQALGELPVTISSTSRGRDSRSRIFFYQVPMGLDFLSKAAPDIDIIQFSHRYALVHPSWHPSGEQYTWYDADGEEMFDLPHVDDMERLPEAWLEWLTVDPNQQTHEGFSGSIEEWLEECEPGDPSPRVQRWIDKIPVDGFDHTDVVRITYNLVRLGAEGEPGIRHAMNRLFELWLRGDFAAIEYRKELTAAIQGAIRKAGRVEVTPESLPPYFDSMGLLPQSVDPQEFLQAVDLQAMAIKLFEHLESERDVASIVWKRAQALGMTDFAEVWKIIVDAQVAKENDSGVMPGYQLLTEEEREHVAQADNRVTKYLEYAERSLPKGQYIPAYHRPAAWVLLSMTYGMETFLDLENGPRPVNVWMISPGPSGTGKSTATKMLFNILDSCYDGNKDYRISTKGSLEGIHDKLTERDGHSMLMADDEVAGQFAKWLNPTDKYLAGMVEAVTQWYDGEVAPRTLVHHGTGEKPGWTTINFCMLGYSTPSNLFESLSAEAFGTGFLARAVWDIADQVVKSEWQPPRFRDPESRSKEKPSIDFAEEWGQQIKAETDGRGKFGIRLSKDAIARLEQAARQIKKSFAGKAHAEDIFEPSTTRLINTIIKCAALLASSEERHIATLDDMLYALSHAEHWMESLDKVAKLASAGGFQRKKDRVLKFLKSKKATQINLGEVSELLGEETRKIDDVINALALEGKLKVVRDQARPYIELTNEGKKP